MIAWGMLETQIDAAIGDLLAVDHTLQQSITANLGTKSKIEIFLSIFHTESAFFPEATLDQANKLGSDTATAAGVYRVWVAHGAPFRLTFPEDEEPEYELDKRKEWIWAKVTARKGGVKGSFAFFTKEIFDKHTESVKSLVMRWNEFRNAVHPRLGWIESIRREESE
ncbi:MAG: hypothetical protein ACR65U_03140 [Methylocystis sp.]